MRRLVSTTVVGIKTVQMDCRPAIAFVRTKGCLGLIFSVLIGQISFSQAPRKMAPSAAPTSETNPVKLDEEGQRALFLGQYALAERDYSRLLKLGLRSPSLYSNLGVVYMRTGRYRQAIVMFNKARVLAPSVAGVRLNLGLAYYREHEFKQAASQFRETLALDPNNSQARYLKGECHFMLDEFSDAVATFEPLESAEHSDLDYLFMLGTSYGMLKRTDESLRIFQRMVEAGDDTPHLHLLLGKAYMALGQNDNALEELKHAAASENVPFAHYYLGVLNRQLGRPEVASAEFEKEIRIDPTNAMAFRELAEVRLDQADPQSAIAILEKGIAQNRDASDLFATLGRAYLQVSNDAAAIRALKKAITLSPGVGSYHYQLGRAYLKAGRLADAHAQMERARALTADAPQGKMQAYSNDRETHTVTDGSR